MLFSSLSDNESQMISGGATTIWAPIGIIKQVGGKANPGIGTTDGINFGPGADNLPLSSTDPAIPGFTSVTFPV